MTQFIPRNAAKFLIWAHNFEFQGAMFWDDWKHMPASVVTEFSKFYNKFQGFQYTMPEDATRAQINDRNNAQKDLTKYIRYMIRFYVRNPAVPESQQIAMGVPPISSNRTQHVNVTEMVDFTIHIRRENEIVIQFQQRGILSRAKPRGYDGAVIIWNRSDTEPATLLEYEGHTLASRTPYELKFPTHCSGKRVWVRIAWQNARGILGDYCEAKSCMIP